MEKSLKPDRKFFIASRWIHLTVFATLIISAAIINLIIHLAEGDPQAANIIWLVCLGLSLILWIIVFPLVQLWIRMLSYHIGDERITICKGIIIKTQQNIPYRAVTDFALKRGPYDRILGIGSIKIQTAGQSHHATGYEGSLSGILDFDDLIIELRDKIKVLHPASEALTTSEPAKISDDNILKQILEEIREIHKLIDKK